MEANPMPDEPALAVSRLVACDPLVGPAGSALRDEHVEIPDLAGEMRRLRITGAIVRSRDALNMAPAFCNDRLLDQVRGHPGLLPAWLVTPDGCAPDYNPAAPIGAMLRRGVRIAWMDPLVSPHYRLRYSFRAWCCGELFEALQRHRIPVLVSYESVPLADLHSALSDFPGLRVILLDIPRLGRQPEIEALLKRHPELVLCFSPSFSVHGGYRDLCARYGPHRWVWGMGYPQAEGGAAVTGLFYSRLDRAQLEAVAFGNIERLLAEVVP